MRTSVLRRAALAAGLVAAVTTVPPAVGSGAPGAPRVVPHGEAARPAVVEVRTLGRSVRGRPIRAFRLGEPGRRRVVLFSTMHGNERSTKAILEGLRDGRAIRGVDLWVVPTYNPDGFAAGTRRNAHGVDLNRNFPYAWADLDGSYESGPGPASEPETRAVMKFLRDVDPVRVLSFHQPLDGVDTDTKDPRFARRVARALRLPRTTLDCGGLCHGTMTMWFNHHFRGTALTVEYGAHPSRRRMATEAPRQLLHLFGAHRTNG
ncbi:M14 family zinc carboxypeptidase [Nocardioides zeicaulis]|uniref:M14 family zinc carboxypeptidase n=1 Tax=Nocardioides zeicaulis TaxID=1776857 RepID=A0ABV6DYK0_9ACTN